jgi:GNAT superfamily N-acetyltransferase
MELKLKFKKAEFEDANAIWKIMQGAIDKRRLEGSKQWQDGYPNLESINSDIEHGVGFVYKLGSKIVAYAAIIFEIELAYETIEGSWENTGKYAVVHRVAVSSDLAGEGIGSRIFLEIEHYVKSKNRFAIRVDTNFDNTPMLKIFEKLNYKYRGKVYFRGSAREAFEKNLL